ncbi:protein phosphatase 1 regulatory subunit 36 [Schistosoma japonicum]|nr:protein phosphatase 1 regulatory subunit 36 [Schistosoma japonicum]
MVALVTKLVTFLFVICYVVATIPLKHTMNCTNPTQDELSLLTTGRFEWADDKNELVFIKFTNQKSQKPIYSWNEETAVALTRLKASGKHFQYSQHFTKMIKYSYCQSQECDRLLISLAKYFECYFKILKFKEKFADEKLLPNLRQLKEQEELHVQIDSLKYEFSLAYIKFLLLERSLTHNACPRPIDPVASSKADQNLYETFFWFFVFCMWIMFLRTRFEEICTEIGWFTRSEMFNSLGRQGASYFGQKDKSNNENANKIYQTHLPRALMLKKCSPALTLLLPNVEQTVHKIRLHRVKDKRIKRHTAEVNPNEENERIGILGDYRHLYDDQLILNKQTIDSDQTKNEDTNGNNDEEGQEEDENQSK